MDAIGIQSAFLSQVAKPVIEEYKEVYVSVGELASEIMQTLDEEELKFGRTIQKGLKEIERVPELDGTIAFQLYETYGFPFELTEEIARERANVEYGTFRKHSKTSGTFSYSLKRNV